MGLVLMEVDLQVQEQVLLLGRLLGLVEKEWVHQDGQRMLQALSIHSKVVRLVREARHVVSLQQLREEGDLKLKYYLIRFKSTMFMETQLYLEKVRLLLQLELQLVIRQQLVVVEVLLLREHLLDHLGIQWRQLGFQGRLLRYLGFQAHRANHPEFQWECLVLEHLMVGLEVGLEEFQELGPLEAVEEELARQVQLGDEAQPLGELMEERWGLQRVEGVLQTLEEYMALLVAQDQTILRKLCLEWEAVEVQLTGMLGQVGVVVG